MAARTSFHMRLWGSGKHRQSHRYSVASQLFGTFAQQVFSTIELHWRHEVAVGQMGQPIAASAHPDKLFRASVVRLELGVRNGPVIAVTIVTCCFEIEIGEAIGHSTPVKGFAPDYARAHPQKGFAGIGGVWMFGVFDVEMSTEFAGGGLHPLINIFPAWRSEAAVHGFVRPAMRTEIAFRVDGRTGFEHQNLHAALSKFLCGHPSGGA